MTFRLRGDLPALSDAAAVFGHDDDGSFLLGDAGWLPATEDRTATYAVTLEVPATHRGVVTGELLSERIDGNTYRAAFRFEGDGDDLAVLFGPYEVEQRWIGDVRLRTYFRSEDAELADDYLDATAGYIERYADLIGAYPFAGFAVVSAPIPVGYGLHGLTYVSQDILAHPYMRGRSLAHEVLHSWWGGAVAVDYATGNWAEGLTTYQADYALAEDRGAEAATRMRRDWLTSLSSLPAMLDRPIRNFQSSEHDRDQSVGYGKVAMVFHMLRQEIGDDAFRAGIRAFWNDNRSRVATWSDLQRAFEDAAGRDLDWFFGQWLDRRGLPTVTLVDAGSAAAGAAHRLTVRLAQADPVYRLRLPLHIETEDGIEVRTVDLAEDERRYELTVAQRPLSVRIDPDFQVARHLMPGELPPTIRDIQRAEHPAAILAGQDQGFEGPARRLAARMLGSAVGTGFTTLGSLDEQADAVLVVGPSDAVARLRDEAFADPTPSVATQGSSRAWVERDPEGMAWMFVSADAPGRLDQDLASLSYYGSESFVVSADGSPAESGRWPVEDSPLRMAVD